MKGIGDKLNGKKIKTFFMNHGEKLGAACVAGIIGFSLMTTEWTGDERTPDELAAQVTDANQKINESKWPAEKQEEVPLQNFLQQAQLMVEDMNIAPFEYRIPMFDPIVKPPQLITDTKWDTVEDLIADSGVVLMELEPEPTLRLPNQTYADTTSTTKDDTTSNIDLKNRRRDDRLRPSGRTGAKFDRKSDDDDEAPAAGFGRIPGGNRLGTQVNGIGRGKNGRADRLGTEDEEPRTYARGQRFAAVRGLFDVRKQKQNLINALRLPIPSEADTKLQFRGFRIQRQRAVAGPEPWKDENWEELDIEEAVRVLADAKGFALPILDPRVTNNYITMPLPPRLIGYWTDEATHPLLEQFRLSDEERDQLEEVVSLLREQLDEQERKEEEQKGGFVGISDDIGKLRQRASEKQMAELRKKLEQSPQSVDERVKEMFNLNPVASGNTPYGTGIAMGRSSLIGGNANTFSSNRQSRSQQRKNGNGFGFNNRPQGPMSQREIRSALDAPQKLSGIEAAIGRVLLFRYLDFTVKPGEAYRYRVKMIFNNPAYEAYRREQVDDEAVIQGETRESDWSEPSEVVVIPQDTHAFVASADVNGEPGRDGAHFEIFQWHQQLGTVIHDKMRCIFGQFIGGTKNTLVLNLAKPSFDNEQATFTSSIALVDANKEPRFDLAEHPDLKEVLGDPNTIRPDREVAIGVPSEAVVINDDGSTVRLDSMSDASYRDELESTLKVVRSQYEDLKDTGDRMSEEDRLFNSGRLGDNAKGGRRDRGSNSLRKKKRKD